MEPEIIILREMSQNQKDKIPRFFSYAESRSKDKRHERKRGTLKRKQAGGGGEKEEEYNKNVLYSCMKGHNNTCFLRNPRKMRRHESRLRGGQ
jgi:hypothetical protein